VYRLRVGDYRVIYEITDTRLTILIVGVGHRREAHHALSSGPLLLDQGTHHGPFGPKIFMPNEP
jgi:hypothetical protein